MKYNTFSSCLIIFILMFFQTACINKNNKNNVDGEKSTIQNIGERINNYKKRLDSINKALEWRKLKCGLWINKNGDIGFLTSRAIGETETKEFIYTDYYIYKFGFNEYSPLKSVIDTATFHYLGSTFYKDKYHIYHHYTMSDGGSFNIYNIADYKTFKIIGDCYAKDKNHIFGERAGILEHVDYKTFISAKEAGCFAKDKNGYYFWDEKISDEELQDTSLVKIIEKLDSLSIVKK